MRRDEVQGGRHYLGLTVAAALSIEPHAFVTRTQKSVGVILPSTLTFNTGAPEIMEGTGGRCEYLSAGALLYRDAGHLSVEGTRFIAPYLERELARLAKEAWRASDARSGDTKRLHRLRVAETEKRI